jgi:hypothetical protein
MDRRLAYLTFQFMANLSAVRILPTDSALSSHGSMHLGIYMKLTALTFYNGKTLMQHLCHILLPFHRLFTIRSSRKSRQILPPLTRQCGVPPTVRHPQGLIQTIIETDALELRPWSQPRQPRRSLQHPRHPRHLRHRLFPPCSVKYRSPPRPQ